MSDELGNPKNMSTLKKEKIEDFLENILSQSQKTAVEEVIYLFCSDEERYANSLYLQGLKDYFIIL